MNEKELRFAVTRMVLTELAAAGEYWVPVAVSSRHCHLCPADLERLFGPGHTLTPLRPLSQPGQFAAEEKVTLETPKGRMSLRVVGPVRKETQVELSLTDARQMGLSPPIRLSGELEGSPGGRLTNGEKSVEISRGIIAAARHLHMSPEEAAAYGLRDGQEVSLLSGGPRGGTMEHLIVRAGKGHLMEVHLDTDEANAFGLRGGELCRLILPGAPVFGFPGREGAAAPRSAWAGYSGGNIGEARRSPAWPVFPGGTNGEARRSPAPPASGETRLSGRETPPAPARKETLLDYSGKKDLLLTEEMLYRAAAQGMKYIRLAPGALVTPLARDVAWEKGIEIVYGTEEKERR